MMRSAPEPRHEPRRHDAAPSAIRSRPCSRGFCSRRPRARLVSRFVQAEQQPALPLLLEVLELEAQERHERRITRLRRASKLPPGKTFDTLDEGRLPPALVRRLHELAEGDFLDDATNVLAFGLPGVGKSHAMCAVGHALVDRGHAVLFMPTYSLVQELLAAKRNLELPRALRKLDHFAVLLLDDVGYIQQSPEEAEILFTLLAERYERRSVCITSNLIFAQWDRIFRDQMATAAAIDRLVHHSVLLEFDVPSFRTEHAKRRGKASAKPSGGRLVTKTTAQDASGSTIASADDLRRRPVWLRPRRSRGRSPRPKRPWTLPAPWTRRRAHRALENGGPFPTSAHRHPRPLDQGEETPDDLTHGQRPANDNYRVPLRSPAGSFADPSPAEIVVANRQK